MRTNKRIREAIENLSGNLDYLTNNDEGRDLTVDSKESVFRQLAGEAVESVVARDGDDQEGVQDDYETFKGDCQSVIEEAMDEGASQKQVKAILQDWIGICLRDKAVYQIVRNIVAGSIALTGQYEGDTEEGENLADYITEQTGFEPDEAMVAFLVKKAREEVAP